ncbi:MAG: hypothetical protein E4H20_05160 [Spirochaetales bacterium]|nr:MAG: hypothetical protein E4H20_05160 [Spirochaetales bacterium]
MHVHDLAEDWRPTVYPRSGYPDGAAWAVINGRDAEALRASGAGVVSLLPDAVFSAEQLEAYEKRRHEGVKAREARVEDGQATVLYPVRGIRRKNLGESLLLSLFLDHGMELAVTLPPNSPRDLPYYDSWRSLATRLSAPMRFGAGLERSLGENYERSFAVATTSIKEGFGLSFLEPVVRGYAVLGRRIGHIALDLAVRGVSLPGLYDAIAVPGRLYDARAMRSRARAAVLRCGVAYGLDDGGERLASEVEALYGDGVDFGRLDEAAQSEVLLSVSSSAAARSDMTAVNSFLEGWASGPLNGIAPSTQVLAAWSEEAYGANLEAIYRSLLEGRVGAAPSRSALLECYLEGTSFHAVGL